MFLGVSAADPNMGGAVPQGETVALSHVGSGQHPRVMSWNWNVRRPKRILMRK